MRLCKTTAAITALGSVRINEPIYAMAHRSFPFVFFVWVGASHRVGVGTVSTLPTDRHDRARGGSSKGEGGPRGATGASIDAGINHALRPRVESCVQSG